MKVILLKDVKNVGKKDQIVEVSSGYANNFLFPRKLAVMQTETSSQILKQNQADEVARQEKMKEDAIKLKNILKDITLEFKAKTGKDGKMFGSISIKQVVEQLKSQYKIEIDKRKFVDKTTIDSLGYVILKNELYKGVIAELRVHVSKEGEWYG